MIGGMLSKPQTILQMSKLVQRVAATSSRNIHCSALRAGIVDAKKGQVAASYARIPALQKKFQVDDGVPVHLKGGTMDIVLYYVTLAMLAVGLAGSFEFIYSQAFPKKGGGSC